MRCRTPLIMCAACRTLEAENKIQTLETELLDLTMKLKVKAAQVTFIHVKCETRTAHGLPSGL